MTAKLIKVTMDRFHIDVLEDGHAVKTITHCAFGRDGHRTPIIADGSLSLTKRDRDHHSTIYNGASMPFALFFEQDLTCAFHQGPLDVASHGCIHLGAADAEWLFDWAAHDPVRLQMQGPYPAAPTR